jgi:hypothetical protein
MRSDLERATQACHKCAGKIGLVPMPPSRRPAAPCARCGHRQFVRVIPREKSATGADRVDDVSAPMYLTHAPTAHLQRQLQDAKPISTGTGIGMLEAYVCRRCGAVEWYCLDAERIPIHPHLMTQLIDYEGQGPYR